MVPAQVRRPRWVRDEWGQPYGVTPHAPLELPSGLCPLHLQAYARCTPTGMCPLHTRACIPRAHLVIQVPVAAVLNIVLRNILELGQHGRLATISRKEGVASQQRVLRPKCSARTHLPVRAGWGQMHVLRAHKPESLRRKQHSASPKLHLARQATQPKRGLRERGWALVMRTLYRVIMSWNSHLPFTSQSMQPSGWFARSRLSVPLTVFQICSHE